MIVTVGSQNSFVFTEGSSHYSTRCLKALIPCGNALQWGRLIHGVFLMSGQSPFEYLSDVNNNEEAVSPSLLVILYLGEKVKKGK